MKAELIREPYGDDLMVVNAARVSFDKESQWEESGHKVDDVYQWKKKLSDRDAMLIQFLARGMTTKDFDEFIRDVDFHFDIGRTDEAIELLWQWRRNPTHWAPFAHPHATFRIKAPIFVARQLAKHQIGMTWSEVSRRYVDDEPEFYTPKVWRKRAENVKQGSSDEPASNVQWLFVTWEEAYEKHILDAETIYGAMIAGGVCPEQARMVLPQSSMTEWIWTGSLYAWANVYNQRKPGGHAQRETQEIARQIGDQMAKYFPVSWEALTQ